MQKSLWKPGAVNCSMFVMLGSFKDFIVHKETINTDYWAEIILVNRATDFNV